MAKLLLHTDFADPVWVNIPGFSQEDIQTNAEYVAYAITYSWGASNGSMIGVISWSQGGLDVQWALKYWPSNSRAMSRVPCKRCAATMETAYVHITSVYSNVDEIVKPMTDPNASGALKDVRNVGVINAQIQLICPGSWQEAFICMK
ncbi:hypothetical protein BDV29DRAFT_63138 [Aspergillus leporis]|uniref:Alpha/Beta hydrolase protein n=1 Tax=Aspergillus leporis TaxID=41062 RepID=A0A5N5WNL5_9EURO|nr:hypothetical protein BDV29DRAFT_63138 [Aspergillus leporis]